MQEEITCSKKILFLLVWYLLFSFSWSAFVNVPINNDIVNFTSLFLSYCFAPLIGWLADVRFGRYEVIKIIWFNCFYSSQHIVLFCYAYWRCFYTEHSAVVSSNICSQLWFYMLHSSHASLLDRSDNWCYFR